MLPAYKMTQTLQGESQALAPPPTVHTMSDNPTISAPNPTVASPNPVLQSLLEKYSPYMYFDKNEPYYPCNIRDYVSNCELYIIGPTGVSTCIKQKGQLNLDILMSKTPAEWCKENSLQGYLALRPPVAMDPSTTTFQRSPNDIVYGGPNWRQNGAIYGRAFKVKIKEKDGTPLNLFAFKYVFTYGYDNPTSCLPFKKAKTPDWHFGDIEHIEVYVQNIEGKPGDIYKVYYAAHGSGEGIWVRPSEMRIENETHPAVYVAKGTHASYSAPGSHVRVLGLFTDVINLEPHQKPWVPNVISSDKDLQIFDTQDMKYGYDSVDTYQGYLSPETNVNQYNTNLCMRFFCVINSCCPDPFYNWVKYGKNNKGNFMSFDHQVLSSQRLTQPDLENSEPELSHVNFHL